MSDQIKRSGDRVVANVERVIVGKHDEVRLALVALLCRGHLLIEDVPGTGKTVLAKSIARSLGCSFRRIQLTPDLLPSDVTGLSIYNQRTQEFEFRPGPIMAQVVLADEINRATPKTQSALLECMEERQATVDGVTHRMPDPFLVIATQNPVEMDGTYPLPEAQLDRFMFNVVIDYLPEDEEVAVVAAAQVLRVFRGRAPHERVAFPVRQQGKRSFGCEAFIRHVAVGQLGPDLCDERALSVVDRFHFVGTGFALRGETSVGKHQQAGVNLVILAVRQAYPHGQAATRWRPGHDATDQWCCLGPVGQGGTDAVLTCHISQCGHLVVRGLDQGASETATLGDMNS